MIPLVGWWPLVRKFWWLVPVTVVAGFAVTYRIQRDIARDALADLRAAQAAQEATYQAQVAQWRQATIVAEEGYAAEIERLRRAAGPVPVVRLCVSPVPAVPRLGAPVPGDGGAGAPGGGVPRVPDGTADGAYDFGPGLYWIADRADRQSAQLRHLLERNRRLSEISSSGP